MTTPLHDSSDKNLKQAKPASTQASGVVVRELVIEVTELLLAGDSFSPQQRALLHARLAAVTQVGYPNKWSKAIDIDRDAQEDLPFDDEDPGHG